MIDRLLVFSNPEVQKLLKEDFIPVAADDWYQRRRKDAEGEFFRKVADQGPRSSGGTRQGHYVFTPGGTLLGYNNNRGADRRLKMMRESLKKWEELPKEARSAALGERGKIDERYVRALPDNVQVIKVYTRILEKRGDQLVALPEKKMGTLTAVDHLWFKKDEVKDLLELVKKGGGEFPKELSRRIARFHLLDNTRGESLSWRKEEIHTMKLEVSSEGLLIGEFSIKSGDEKMGYEGEIRGKLSFGRDGGLSIFECLVIGEHWGEGPWTRGARPGRSPLGQVLKLSPATSGHDQIPPQSIRSSSAYWAAE